MADHPKRNGAYARRTGLRPLAKAADAVTRPAFGRRGFAMGQLLTHWPQIAGEGLADLCHPHKLHFAQNEGDNGTLWIVVDGAAALELQHLQPVLIERINRLCGFRAVGGLRILQGPVPARPKKPAAPRPLRPAEKKAVLQEIEPVSDPQLRASLERLGYGIQARKKPC